MRLACTKLYFASKDALCAQAFFTYDCTHAGLFFNPWWNFCFIFKNWIKLELFCKKAVLRNFISLTEKLVRWSPLFCKVTVPQSFTKYLRQTLVFMWNRTLREKFNWRTTGKVQFLCFGSFLLIQWNLRIAGIPNNGHVLNSGQNVQSQIWQSMLSYFPVGNTC